MESDVQRTRHAVGRHGGETTLQQTFAFGGGVTADAIGDVLRSEPLVGPDSIFGDRAGEETDTGTASRRLRGFSPAPGFRFDVELSEREPGVFVATFSQPDRRAAFLEGEAVWFVRDEHSGAVFDEEINTERALAAEAAPLRGHRLSLRRWLFFRVGHAQVMRDATRRIARLARTS